jgi:flavin reductase (DIM6/NTAB) family NADH-FMN oxidoreductase RutF/rubredoxin
MIDFEALYGISYGLYIVSSGNQNRGNGFISNTVFQVTAEPPRFAICCNKDNYTSEFIRSTGLFAVSILEINTPQEIFTRFGYKSGREMGKFNGMNIRYTENGVPVVLDHALSFMECRVENTIDMDTHWLFTARLLHSEMIDGSLQPITYQYYREVKKGVAPKNAPTYIDLSKKKQTNMKEDKAEYKCEICGYIYNEAEEDVRFADLPDDWTCPLCGADKESFRKI